MSVGTAIKDNLKTIIIGLVVVALLGGGIAGWMAYQHRQTPEYFAEQVHAKLLPGKALGLASSLDLPAVLGQLSAAVAAYYPFIEQGADQQQRISERIKKSLITILSDTSKPSADRETDPDKKLLRNLTVLPPDFIDQCAKTMRLTNVTSTSAVLMFTITHPQLENKQFQLAFGLSRTSDGWKITSFANARQVVQEFRSAQLQRMEAKRAIFIRKYEADGDRMKNALPLSSCTVSAGMLSDKRTVLAVVHVLARNKQNVGIKNVNLLTAIENSQGQEILRRNLNASHEVHAGEDFNYRWTIDLEASDPIAQQLLASPSLVCKARWYSIGFANGQILYDIEDVTVPEDFQ